MTFFTRRLLQTATRTVARTTPRFSGARPLSSTFALATFSANENDRNVFLATAVVAATAAAALSINSSNNNNNKADCCGIAGVVGTPGHDARYVFLQISSSSSSSSSSTQGKKRFGNLLVVVSLSSSLSNTLHIIFTAVTFCWMA